jgi:hypothetical protein
VVTTGASPVATSTATLNGSADPNGAATTGWFRYYSTDPGTCNTTTGTPTSATGLGSGSSGVPYSQSLTGLSPSTTYYYCALANNTAGTVLGDVWSFTTNALTFDFSISAQQSSVMVSPGSSVTNIIRATAQ